MNINLYLKNNNILPDQLKKFSGLNNDAYLINTKINDKYLIIKKSKSPNKIIYDKLVEYKLAPEITNYLQDGHIEHYIPSNILTISQVNKIFPQLAEMLGKLHKLPITNNLINQPIKFWDWIDDEYNNLDLQGKKIIESYFDNSKDIPIQISRMRRILDPIQIPNSICHNDLHLGNLLIDSNDKIHIIDWEYCHVNPCLFDLAPLVYNLHLGDYDLDKFLEIYQKYFRKISNLSYYLKLYLTPNRLWWGLWAINQLKNCIPHTEKWYQLKHLIDNCFLLYKSLLDSYFPINIYVVGVFDLLHLGHMNLLKKAKQLTKGGKLIVGVHNDELVKNYKRTPITKYQDRVEMIKQLKWVDSIIENAPSCYTCKKDWYIKNNIDYHIAGEYADYYQYQKSIGIFKQIDSQYYTHTTDIIKKLNS